MSTNISKFLKTYQYLQNHVVMSKVLNTSTLYITVHNKLWQDLDSMAKNIVEEPKYTKQKRSEQVGGYFQRNWVFVLFVFALPL